MCGIAGWLGSPAHDDPYEILGRMSGAISHRGPDDSGMYIDEETGVALGSRRLSIIDLSESGHQPMESSSGRYVITYNGEIYNYRSIRDDLEKIGCRFKGNSDTEVLLTACDRWGLEKTLDQAVGMFAFALWDRATRRLHLVKDRLGKKPLYFGWLGNSFAFASELKALRHHPNWTGRISPDALASYFRLGYVPTPLSIYEGIHKLEPGTIATTSLSDRSVSKIVYWDAYKARENTKGDPAQTLEGAAAELSSLLHTAVSERLVSDVPLGAFLSGGIDSSTVVAIMQEVSSRPVKTFSIGFREAGYDESPHAEAVAAHLGTDHTSLIVSPSEASDVIPQLPAIFDEPFGDSSAIPTYLVSKLARRDVTVALSGDGGDELFGGYNRHRIIRSVLRFQKVAPQPVLKALTRTLTKVSPHTLDRLGRRVAQIARRGAVPEFGSKVHKLAEILEYEDYRLLYERLVSNWQSPDEVVVGGGQVVSVAQEWPDLNDPLGEIMLRDLTTYLLDDILVKVDRASMAVGLEARCPLLDHRLVEFALRLPTDLKIRKGPSKPILRKVLYDHVPRSLLERPKAGFAIPVGEWVKGPLRGWAEDLLNPNLIKSQGYLNSKKVAAVWSEHQQGRGNHQHRVWALLMFQSWLQREGDGC